MTGSMLPIVLRLFAISVVSLVGAELACQSSPLGAAPLTEEIAVTTCNINTGVATGLDAGTCANPIATCDGVTNNAAAFMSFNKWAKATRANANGQLIELRVTGDCAFSSGNAKTFTGLKKARLWGYGATFKSNDNQPALGPAGDATPAGICHKGLNHPAGCSARIKSVSAGATSVTITNTAFCSRFVTGRWAVVAGFDLQGGYNAPYGYPPNPHFFDYVQIASTKECASSGQLVLSKPLTNDYLSTWPHFNSGNTFEADQGGPATIYALDTTWGGEVDIRGVTFASTKALIFQGRAVTLRDVTMTGSGMNTCVIPSQNESFTMINSSGPKCDVEVDKIIDKLNYSGTVLGRLSVQSSSTNTLSWDGGSFTRDLNGTPKVAHISNVTIPILTLGPYAYGVATSATCTNCVIQNEVSGFGYLEKGGDGEPGAIPFYTVKGGVFSYPNAVRITNMTANPQGKVRLTVPDSTGWATGAAPGNGGSIFSKCTVPCSGGLRISVVDSTTIDLVDFNFSDVTWSGGGFLYNSARPQSWGIPGTNILPGAFLGFGAPAFQAKGVTQDAAGVHIATTLPDSYPLMPQNGAKRANIKVQAPKWTCIKCSGNPQAAGDFNLAPPNTPILSYANRTWQNDTKLTNIKLVGKVSSIKLNVTQAYNGSTNPLRQNFSGFAYPPDQATVMGFNWNINLRQAGLRTITPLGVTCDTGSGPVAGACNGDTIAKLNHPATFFAAGVNLARTDGAPTDRPWTLKAEFVMDQGVRP